ncbi:hypothetical protein SAMN06272735_5804 [Streptomyces sp. TLI_55]|uniref:hypothetical protein n=1 Tax=Streptomyces sp. TLI_55 TaxID=1938861 RepID=UPI000BCFFA11|nr:hypothetical protein [Streptomyces sp. TLI_55]SNX63990.1 hypothetical protein SAMN06272735_5804 [Streptomyces sp. TLI_55]
MRAARKIAVAATTAVASMGALLAVGSPAQAGTITEFCNHPGSLAPGCFYSTGDVFTVQDLRVDGLRAVLKWTTDYGRSGECHDANGANNPPTRCDVDLREGRTLIFTTVLRNGADGADQGESLPTLAYTSGR